MDFQDHDYTNACYEKFSPLEFTYKMNSKEVEDFVKIRVSNNGLFSGRRNTSMQAWRAILKHMCLQHKMSHSQASKKWENMKKRYKELKNPPDGVKAFPETWPFFSLMDDAMEGRLEGSAPILKSLPNNGDFLAKSKKRKVSMVINSCMESVTCGTEINVSLNGEEDVQQAAMEEEGHIMRKVDQERNMMVSERQLMEREKQVMQREQQVLQRERAVLDREIAALDRDRASLEREKATMERERALLEREKAIVDKDRDAVSREQLALEREKARMERLPAPKERMEGDDSASMDRKERFLVLFEKLIENF